MVPITFGMATYDDFHGVWFTLRSLMIHQGLQDGDEIIVIDNNPNSNHGSATKDLCHKMGVRYVEYPNAVGTTQSRQAVFTLAQNDVVMCMDCHVMLPPGAISKTREWFAKNPDSRDIVSGPMMLDDGWHYTHFDLTWRGQMWGVWGTAWQHNGQIFTVQKGADGKAAYYHLDAAMTPLEPGHGLPDIPFDGHQMLLVEHGLKPVCCSEARIIQFPINAEGRVASEGQEVVRFNRGLMFKYESDKVDAEPFETPANGLGLFACRKKHWPGFNPNYRGFGAEEGYIHTKVRRNGGRSLCLPWLVWHHRFQRPDGHKYPLTLEHKVRNYVIGFQELGFDIEPIREHFLSEGMKQEWWDKLIADPVGMRIDPAARPVSPKGRSVMQPQPFHVYDMNGVYEWTKTQNRDLNKHLDTLKEFASRCDTVVEMTKRRESTVAFGASSAKRVISFTEEPDAILDYVERYGGKDKEVIITARSLNTIPEPKMNGNLLFADMLFIDSRHTGKRLTEELQMWSPYIRKYIALHDTALHHEKGEDGEEGFFPVLREFCHAFPKWRPVYHTPNQYGLTILGCDPADAPLSFNPWPKGYGPGTEMFTMLQDIGVTEKPGCSCKQLALKMDEWGVEGCRENFDYILKNVKENAEKWSWAERLRIAAINVSNPSLWKLAWKINPLKVEESLIVEAIARANGQDNPYLSCANNRFMGCQGTCEKGCK